MSIDRWFYKLPLRLRSLFKKNYVEDELNEEIQYHIDQQIEQYTAKGFSPKEAKYMALRSIGGVEQRKEECREMRRTNFIEHLVQDISFGLRVMFKNPAFLAVAVMTLALSIGATTAIFTVVNAVLLRPLPYPEPDRLVNVGRTFPKDTTIGELSPMKFVFVRDNTQSLDAVTATVAMDSDAYLSDENQTDYITGLYATEGFFRVLGVQPIGRGFTPEEDKQGGPRVVVLGDGLWRRKFGADISILGKTIRLNGAATTVVGIMPAGFEYLGPKDVIVPANLNPLNTGANWTVIGRLKPGITRDQAQAELQTVFDKFQATHPSDVLKGEKFGLRDWRTEMTSGVRELLWILLGAVACVLLIACANVANLQLIRAASRQKEMAVRTALGASNGRIVRQLLTEGIILAILGGGLGVLLADWGLKAMLTLVPAGMLPRIEDISLDGRVLAFAAGASLLTGIAFSLAPALQALRVDVHSVLKEGGGKTSASVSQVRLRHGLVIVEVALAMTLTIGAGLLLRTFANLRGIGPGFDANKVLTFEVSPRGRNYDSVAKVNDFYGRALEKFRNLPGVETAAITNKLPFDRWFNLPYRFVGHTDLDGSAEYRLVSRDYFKTMKMEVRRGRGFAESDAGGEPVAIVNEAFVRKSLSGVDPIGQQLCMGCEYGDPTIRRIVGVVNETKQRELTEAPPQTVFIPLSQTFSGARGAVQRISFVLRTSGDPSLLAAAVQGEIRQLDPTVLMRNLRPMDQLVSNTIAPQRFNLWLVGSFAVLGLLLAAVGIYGVMAYGVAQRTHEIGIRMALGAQNSDVLKLVISQAVKLAFIGVAIGTIASLGLTRLLKTLLYGVSTTDPMTFVLIAALLIVIALIASYLPTRRAMKVDPMMALHYE
ncbi:MAG TPA: ABC transporter permease [Blastocatellia bacterium]|nr:ABC transporter permease [Blastocatellia bacterium]